MAYHYDNRRLNFLRSPDLVRLVETLESHPSARAAFDALDIDERRWSSFERALASLALSDFLEIIVMPQANDSPTTSELQARPTDDTN